MGSKQYWDRKIIAWEQSSYENTRGLNCIEKLATRFRGPIKLRRQIAHSALAPLVKGKRVLELGCGTGGFCFELLRGGAAEVIGLDIAEAAVAKAAQRAKAQGVDDRARFMSGDIRDTGLPEADYVVGLGFIDYIDLPSLKAMLSGIQGLFFFSFPEKKTNLINILHYFYLKSQNCPEFYKFRRTDFAQGPGFNVDCHFSDINGMTFISNFKI